MSIFGKQKFFLDRPDAGKKLSKKLQFFKNDHPVVLALPRGGVPVAYEVAKALDAPLDVFIIRKLGAPHNPEFGIGGIAEGGAVFLNEKTITKLAIPEMVLAEIIGREEAEIQRRRVLYRRDRPLTPLKNKTVILVDDGLATGVSAQAAIKAIRKMKPQKLVLAVPVCAYQTKQAISKKVDNFVCVYTPYDLQAIGIYYKNFTQTTDEEVIKLLREARDFVNK